MAKRLVVGCAALWASVALAGTSTTTTMRSTILNRDVAYTIVLPTGYDAASDRYPVLYALHGLGGTSTHLTGMLATSLNAQPRPLIVAGFSAGDSWYIDATAVTNSACLSFFLREFIPYIDAHYRTVATARGRGVTGLSMGGYGALRSGLERADLFGSISTLSAAFPVFNLQAWSDQPSVTALVGAWNPNAAGYKSNDLYRLLAAKPASNLPPLYVTCGTGDFLYAENTRMRDYLTAYGFACEYHESAGQHDDAFWQGACPGVLAFHAAQFTDAGGRPWRSSIPPEPLSFAGAFNCDGYVTTNEINAVAAWYAAQAPDYAAARDAVRGKYMKGPNTAFTVAGPWVRGGAHNTAFDNDLTWFYNPADAAHALATNAVATTNFHYVLALGSGFDAAPLPAPQHGAALPARLNVVRLGLAKPTAGGATSTSVVVNLKAPLTLSRVNFLLSGTSGSTNECRPRLRIQVRYTDGTTPELFVSPDGNGSKPLGVPAPNAGLATWGGWVKTGTLEAQLYGCYMLSQNTGTTNDPCRGDWKATLGGAMFEPAIDGFALDRRKTVAGFTLILDGTESVSAYTGGEDVNLYALSGAVVRGVLMMVR